MNEQIRRRKPINTFAVVYYGSTGSTWLIATLKNSKGVYVPAFEPLETWQWKAPDTEKLAWLRNAFSPPMDRDDEEAMAAWMNGFTSSPEFKGPPQRTFHTIGTKITAGAVEDQGALLDLLGDRGTRLVFLQRENRVKHALSLYRHHEEGKSQFRRSGTQSATKVNLRRFDHWLADSTRQHAQSTAFHTTAVDRLGPDDVIALEYASIVSGADKAEVIGAVASFLGLSDPAIASESFEKATPDDLQAAISNYDRVYQRYRGTECGRYLRD